MFASLDLPVLPRAKHCVMLSTTTLLYVPCVGEKVGGGKRSQNFGSLGTSVYLKSPCISFLVSEILKLPRDILHFDVLLYRKLVRSLTK